MATITQDLLFRLSLIRYAEKYGITKAAVKYHVNRQYIYRWKKRFDGSPDSLRYLSRRPHRHPNQHNSDEGVTSVLFQGSTVFLKNRALWL